ncbi:MAG TPA: hypothetical protein VKP67_00110 [Xanthobacteraceae bacterium]|nr:hypothetical protein [Xanthobacteraceae bacterium]
MARLIGGGALEPGCASWSADPMIWLEGADEARTGLDAQDLDATPPSKARD